jgi:hypothetical protein
MTNKKQRLEHAIEEISTPIFSTKTSNNQHFNRLLDAYSATILTFGLHCNSRNTMHHSKIGQGKTGYNRSKVQYMG